METNPIPVNPLPIVSSPPPITPLSPITSPKKSYKLLWLLVVLVLLSAAGCFAYGYYQKHLTPLTPLIPLPSPTISATPNPPAATIPADWKTYKNTKYGFQISYPPELKIGNILPTENLDTAGEVNFRNISDITPAESGFSIIVEENIDKLASQICQTASDSNPEPEGFLCANIITPKTVTINGIKWEQLNKLQVSFPPTGHILYNTINNKNLVIIYNWGSEKEENSINQILSTFQFIDNDNVKIEDKTGIGCKIGGCSSELCADANSEDITSICIYKDEYACYKNAKCEKQANGKCGWTATPKLNNCLQPK